MFKRDDWTLFRNLGTLSQEAGVAVDQIPSIVAKELVDNALDASGNCNVEVDPDGTLIVEDHGDGIPGDDAQLAAMFSFGRPLTSSKLWRLPTRGALGNGLRVVAGAVAASGGGEIRVTTGGRTVLLRPRDDGTTLVERAAEWPSTGTRVEVDFGPKLRVTKADLAWARDAILLAGGTGGRYSGRTSSYWYDDGSFFELLNASDDRTVRSLVAEMDGCSTNPTKIAGTFSGRIANTLDRAEAVELLGQVRAATSPVNPDRLGRIGDKVPDVGGAYIRASGTFTTKGSRSATHRPELPYVLEVWAEVADRPECLVSVNRTPIPTGIEAHHYPKTMKQNLFNCGLKNVVEVGRRPMRVRINVETPYMPIWTVGKAPDLGPLVRPIVDAIAKSARKAKKAQPARAAGGGWSKKALIMERIPEAVAKASGDGRTRFSMRQLYYVVRPHVIAEFGGVLDYGYFGQVVTDYEDLQGCDIPGMYRDSRGTI